MEAVNLKIITDELSKFSGMVKEEEIQGLADEIKKEQGVPGWQPEDLPTVCCIWDLMYTLWERSPARRSKKEI